MRSSESSAGCNPSPDGNQPSKSQHGGHDEEHQQNHDDVGCDDGEGLVQACMGRNCDSDCGMDHIGGEIVVS